MKGQKFNSLHPMTTVNDRFKSLIGDIGKATLRGVRKCPKCGTYNGTRGISCKNKACGAVFKDGGDKKKTIDVDCVKVVTASNDTQVYSVKSRDRGPDYRSFVQVPIIQEVDSSLEQVVDDLAWQNCVCFADSCQKSQDDNNLSFPANLCSHVKATLNCLTEAEPLSLKNSVLNALLVSNEIKQAIWILATENAGPLVQRVSRNSMVIKCKPTNLHPLGLLHFYFIEKSRSKDNSSCRFYCTCQAGNFRLSAQKDEAEKRCVHFYACLCAVASSEKLLKEFSPYLGVGNSIFPEQQLMAILKNSQQESVCDELSSEMTMLNSEVSLVEEILPLKKPGSDDLLVQTNNSLLTLHTKKFPKLRRKPPVKKTSDTALKKIAAKAPIDETAVSYGFQQWLASITERIHQTMHYQFDGHPEPLVFHAPQAFFDCLQQRISAGSKKKRLPNLTTTFERKDSVPLGTFSKYTLHITNILHVKQIFDTQQLPLEITQNFIENRDGTYDLYEVPKSLNEDLTENFSKTDSSPLIKPSELKTFLKVGTWSPEQKEPTPFIIEWIPDIQPKTHIGELRIKFEYGHQRNGHIEQRTAPSMQHVLHIQHISVP